MAPKQMPFTKARFFAPRIAPAAHPKFHNAINCNNSSTYAIKTGGATRRNRGAENKKRAKLLKLGKDMIEKQLDVVRLS